MRSCCIYAALKAVKISNFLLRKSTCVSAAHLSILYLQNTGFKRLYIRVVIGYSNAFSN